jgi:hypothetical protein
VAVGAFYAFPVLAAELDESAIPTADQAHVTVDPQHARAGKECASGGCWLRLTFATRDLSDAERASLLAMDGTCQTVAWFDLRRVCASVEERDAALVADLMFDRVLGL